MESIELKYKAILKTKWVILFLIGFLFIQGSSGQAQLNIPEYIRQKFESYCKSVPREEIYIHTDKEDYFSGDDIWYSTYLFDRQSSKPSLNSRIAYVEILNPENRQVARQRILLENGIGPGHIVLPDTLSSGTYTLRAYTSWMKNFLPENCFIKEINVYNAYRNKVFRKIVRNVKAEYDSLSSSDKNPGCKLAVNNLRADSIEIKIYTNEKFRIGNSNLIYLFIQSHGIISHLNTEGLKADSIKVTLARNSLPEGINQITIFDSKGPVLDRFIYIFEKESNNISLQVADSCKRREKVIMDLQNANNTGRNAEFNNLSISVSIGNDPKEVSDINNYLIFGTEFGLFPAGKYRGKKISDLDAETADSLMLTLKSNWINWESVFSPEPQVYKYKAEKDSHYITGTLLNGKLQPAGADETVILSKITKQADFQYTTTDKNGNFCFSQDIDDDPEDLVIQPDYKIKDQRVYIDPSFPGQYPENEIIVDSSRKILPPYLLRGRINYQVSKIFKSSFEGERITPLISTLNRKRFYGKPDFELKMKDFVSLDSMQEVFFELVPHVTLDHVNGVDELSVTDLSRNRLEGEPTIMVDGIIFKNLSLIAKLDPDLIERIEVVWDPYRVGEYVFYGIVNLISKSGNLISEIMPYDAIRFNSIAIDPVVSFVSPDYSTPERKESRIADYRSTLYWNPSVKPDSSGKAQVEFWSGDNKADYIINIEGITQNGKPVSLTKIIHVK